MCTHNPIILKTTPSSDDMRIVINQARNIGLKTTQFTKEMLEIAEDKKLHAAVSAQKSEDISYYGVMIY